MGPSIESTIIESNLDLPTLSTQLWPLFTAITSSSLEFFNSVAVTPVPSCPRSFLISASVNQDISLLPMYSATFEVIGLNCTVYAHLKLLVATRLLSELQLAFKTIDRLATFRALSYFMILCNTFCTDTAVSVHMDLMASVLHLWNISVKVIYTVDYGDPIAAYRVCFNGRLSDEKTSPSLSLTSTATSESTELSSVIDVNGNHKCFSITCLPITSIEFTTIGKCPKQPLPIAVSSNRTITAVDVVLHHYFPGILWARIHF